MKSINVSEKVIIKPPDMLGYALSTAIYLTSFESGKYHSNCKRPLPSMLNGK
jgi:hypothetical protein